MSKQLDPNTIVAQFLQQNIDEFIDTAKGILKMGVDKLRLHLDRTYKAYLTNVFKKYSKAKSFLLRGEQVPLYNFYVPLHLGANKKIFKSPTLRDIQNISNCIIITGSAGSGKSMMMRHLLLNSVIAKNKVPIFLELRQFNTADTDLISLLKKVLHFNKFNLDETYVDKAFYAGHFVIFLDGYDEVANAKRSQVRQNIYDFTKRYDKNIVVMSSRPDSELDGWAEFAALKIQALSLEQASELIGRVPYDDDLKNKFLKDLRSGLFEQHKSFLSNPLLLSIMLLTYGQSANIPTKLNVFYNQAYETLFERHDALKSGYKRERLTTLDIQDFARLFAAFCLQAYDKRQLEFTRIQALGYIEKSQEITGLKCHKDNYLKDLIQAVCLLVEEGLQIVYTHRSFQEYFAARFIADARPDIQEQLIKKYSKMSLTDAVFHLLYEMRSDIVDTYYLIPGLDHLFQIIGAKKKIGLSHYIKFMRLMFSAMEPAEHGYAFTLKDTTIFHLIAFAQRHCAHLIDVTASDKIYLDWQGDSIFTLLTKHCKAVSQEKIVLEDYPDTSALLRELAKIPGHWSLKALIDLDKIRAALKQKTITEEKSLESILESKPEQGH